MSRIMATAMVMLLLAACTVREQRTCYKIVEKEPHEAVVRSLAVTPCPPEQGE